MRAASCLLAALLSCSCHARASASDDNLASNDGLAFDDNPRAWHQQLARIVDVRFNTFAHFAGFARDAKKAGVSALMLVQPQKTASCPGGWYNGLQLCDHINGSYPAADGTLAEWQALVAELKPVRLMWWLNANYWSVQGEVWAQAKANHAAQPGSWFSYNATDADQCGGLNPADGQGGHAQGSWGSQGIGAGYESALASFCSPTYANYMADALGNSWAGALSVDGFTVDCSGAYGPGFVGKCKNGMLQCPGGDGLAGWAGIVGKTRKIAPQSVFSGEGYGSWAEVIKADADIGGQGFGSYHDAMQAAVTQGQTAGVEAVASSSGSDAASVVCYLNAHYDGRQPGACPTMYFRDMTAQLPSLAQHNMWVALEAGNGIVSEHDFDPDSWCHAGPEQTAATFNGCSPAGKGAWWNVTADPAGDDGAAESPLWAFNKFRALNRLALRTPLPTATAAAAATTAASSAAASSAAVPAGYTAYDHQNTYQNAGSTEIDADPVATGQSAAQCSARCTADAACDCVVLDNASGDCWRRASCVPAKFENDAPSQPYSTFVKAAPAGYALYAHQNAYGGHGATDIDENPAKGLSAEQCAQRCSDDASCQCVTHCGTSSSGCDAAGDCWKRGNCVPSGFEHDDATQAFSVFLKAGVPTPAPPTDGPLAYLKHDSMGPAGDAAILVFNPFDKAANVSIDLSILAGNPVLNGKTTPYDLLALGGGGDDYEAAVAAAAAQGVPPLAASWTVAMGPGEFKFFGGFSLGVFAPRQGKKASCTPDDAYTKTAKATTLQGCFLECAADAQCENVFIKNSQPTWMEAPPALECELMGAVKDPAASCTAGDGTLVNKLPGARSCAHLWTGRGRKAAPPAPGAPPVAPGPQSPLCPL